jgi:plastocyanin
MTRLGRLLITFVPLGMFLALLPGGSERSAIAEAQQPSRGSGGPRTVTVLVAGGHDTIVLDSFFPRNVRVRVGDTVVWKFNGDENHHLHTVTFSGGPFSGPQLAVAGGVPGEALPDFWVPVPGGQPGELMWNPTQAWPTRSPGAPVEKYDGRTYAHSGHMRMNPLVPGMPAAREFSMTFTKPGLYRYACQLHAHMHGTIEVVPASSKDVPSQAEIDREAKAETERLLELIEKGKALAKNVRSQPGPNGTAFWYVRAGVFDRSVEMGGILFDFAPKELTVKAGDTVIWQSVDPHTITFVPAPPPPVLFDVRPRQDGPPFIVRNEKIWQPAKPASVYDAAQYFNSGAIGVTTPQGTSWALTFDKPGVYEYICALHHPMGMKGTITVAAR